MFSINMMNRAKLALALLCGLALVTGCESIGSATGNLGRDTKTSSQVTPPVAVEQPVQASPEYLIGPLDQLQIFVWRAPELSTNVTVRPDGRISTPLVEDMMAAGKTPTILAKDVEAVLSSYVKNPEVTVIVNQFSSTFDQQVRVLGEAQKPIALPYQAGMTVLDVMVAVGGLTEFAAGNKAILYRGQGANRKAYRLKLDDLMRKADVGANVPVLPGDVILIPESFW